MNCCGCKFYDTDYEFNGEDEYEIGICEAGHNEYLDSDEDCPYFKKYRQRKYVEKDTDCDKCEFLDKCKDDGYVINCTSFEDSREHYMSGLGSNCRSSKYAKRI